MTLIQVTIIPFEDAHKLCNECFEMENVFLGGALTTV